MSGKITLRYEGDGEYGALLAIVMELDSGQTLDELLENFQGFVLAIGYRPQGSFEINTDEYQARLELEHHYKGLLEENKKLGKKLKKLAKRDETRECCECGELDCPMADEGEM